MLSCACRAERAVIEYDPAFWSPEKLAEARSLVLGRLPEILISS